jgi:hypothetical protein
VWPVGVYLAGAGVLTLIALLLSKETKDVDYTAVAADDDTEARRSDADRAHV